jgi:hypothetical protein
VRRFGVGLTVEKETGRDYCLLQRAAMLGGDELEHVSVSAERGAGVKEDSSIF